MLQADTLLPAVQVGHHLLWLRNGHLLFLKSCTLPLARLGWPKCSKVTKRDGRPDAVGKRVMTGRMLCTLFRILVCIPRKYLTRVLAAYSRVA